MSFEELRELAYLDALAAFREALEELWPEFVAAGEEDQALDHAASLIERRVAEARAAGVPEAVIERVQADHRLVLLEVTGR